MRERCLSLVPRLGDAEGVPSVAEEQVGLEVVRAEGSGSPLDRRQKRSDVLATVGPVVNEPSGAVGADLNNPCRGPRLVPVRGEHLQLAEATAEGVKFAEHRPPSA